MPVLRLPMTAFGRPEVSLMVDLSTATRSLDAEIVFQPHPITALLDTGATRSLISIDILESCGFVQAGEIPIITASSGPSPEMLPLFWVNLWIAGEQSGLLAENLEVAGSDKLDSLRVDMLLGRDILNQCLLVYDGAGRCFALAYDSPLSQ